MSSAIRLRDSVVVFSSGADTMDFVSTITKVQQSFEVDELAFRLIPMLDGSRTREDLADALPGVPASEVDAIIDVLSAEGLLAVADIGGSELDSAEAERYSRQLGLFEELSFEAARPVSGWESQRRLAAATVAVVGTGGLGGAVVASLAAVGVGRIRIWDPDTVSLSNLNRQLLYGQSDVGRPKYEAAADRLRDLNELVVVEASPTWLDDAAPFEELLEGTDIVVNCADQPSLDEASALVSHAAVRAGVPHLVGGSYVYALGVLGTTVIPGVTACWECIRRDAADEVLPPGSTVLRGRTLPGAGLAMFSALTANVLAWEVTRIVIGLPPLLAGQWGEIDFTNLRIDRRAVDRRPDCESCGASVPVEVVA